MPVVNGINYTNYGAYADTNFTSYSGAAYMTPAHPAFRLGKIGKRWVCVDPSNRLAMIRACYDVRIFSNQALGGSTQAGRSQESNINAKYGSIANWRAPMQNRLRTFHFNALGPHSDEAVGTAVAGAPGMMALANRDHGQYAKSPSQSAGKISEPVKDIIAACHPSAPGNSGANGTSWLIRTWGDWLDPKWAQFVNIEWAAFGTEGSAAHQFFTCVEGDWISQCVGGGHPDETGCTWATAGYWIVHMGMAILISRPTVTSQFMRERGENVTWTIDTQNWSKRRLIDDLKIKYNNNIASLNSAWQTGGYYVSFESEVGGGGWGVGRGVMDEDGRRPRTWFGSNGATFYGHTQGENDMFNSTRWAPGVKVDLDNMLYISVCALLEPNKIALHNQMPGALFGGGASGLGGGDAPTRIPVLQAYRDHVDWYYSGAYNKDSGTLYTLAQADLWAQYEYTHTSGKPCIGVYYSFERDDSSMYYFGDIGMDGQVVRGQRANDRFARMMNFQASDGTYPYLGHIHWAAYDHVSEQAGWGMISMNDNPYDGRDYTAAGGTVDLVTADPYTPGRTVRTEDSPPAGNPFPSGTHYGDYLGYGGTASLVRNDLLVGANIYQYTRLLEQIAAQGSPTLVATTRAFTLTGQAVALTAATPFRLVASPASFSLTGLPATTTKATLAAAFSDNFDRVDNTNLGAAWEEVSGDLRIISQPARVNPLVLGTTSRARRTTGLPSADCYAQVRVHYQQTPTGVSSILQVYVRGSATDQTAVGFVYSKSTTGVVTASLVTFGSTGASTVLASITDTIVAGDVVRVEAIGTTLYGKKNGVTILTATNPQTTAGSRGGFGIRSGTGVPYDFEINNFQEGSLGVGPLIMTATPASFVLTGQDATTAKLGQGLQADPVAFVLTGQDATLSRLAQVLTATVATFVYTGIAAGTFKVSTGDPGVFLARVVRFVPGRTLLLIVRATVPSGQEFFYADPAAVSLHPEVPSGGAEETALRAGTIVEKRVSVTAPVTYANLQLVAEAEQAAFQAEVDASDVSGMTGLYGVGTRWSGTDWG